MRTTTLRTKAAMATATGLAALTVGAFAAHPAQLLRADDRGPGVTTSVVLADDRGPGVTPADDRGPGSATA